MLTKTDIMQLIGMVRVHYPFNYKDFKDNDYIILRDSWYDDLKEYPKELVFKCFNEAKKVNKISVTTADIIEQIEKIKTAFGKSEQQLWAEFRTALEKAGDCVYKFKFKMIEDNGKTQGENAQEELQRLYEGLPAELQRYCGNISGLKNLSQLDDEELEFEKARFLKHIGRLKESVKIQNECPQFEKLVSNIGKLLN